MKNEIGEGTCKKCKHNDKGICKKTVLPTDKCISDNFSKFEPSLHRDITDRLKSIKN